MSSPNTTDVLTFLNNLITKTNSSIDVPILSYTVGTTPVSYNWTFDGTFNNINISQQTSTNNPNISYIQHVYPFTDFPITVNMINSLQFLNLDLNSVGSQNIKPSNGTLEAGTTNVYNYTYSFTDVPYNLSSDPTGLKYQIAVTVYYTDPAGTGYLYDTPITIYITGGISLNFNFNFAYQYQDVKSGCTYYCCSSFSDMSVNVNYLASDFSFWYYPPGSTTPIISEPGQSDIFEGTPAINLNNIWMGPYTGYVNSIVGGYINGSENSNYLYYLPCS